MDIEPYKLKHLELSTRILLKKQLKKGIRIDSFARDYIEYIYLIAKDAACIAESEEFTLFGARESEDLYKKAHRLNKVLRYHLRNYSKFYP